MKQIKWHLLLLALLGICAGYANKPKKFLTARGQEMDTYAFWYAGSGRLYYGMDLSAVGWIQGIDYDCVYSASYCTFIADPTRSHSDVTGNWFYTSDVPESGIYTNAVFQLMDE